MKPTQKPATPHYWKSNEEIAVLLMSRGINSDIAANVLRRVEARIETQQKLGYKSAR